MRKQQDPIGGTDHGLRRETAGVALLLWVATGPAGLWPLDAAEPAANPPPASLSSAASGEELARQVCSSCHLFPEPRILDKQTWKEQVLPRMEAFLGVSPPDYSSSPEGELLRELHIYPDFVNFPKAEWARIVAYILESAPESALPRAASPVIEVGLKQFASSPVRFRFAPPSTTLVKLSSTGQRVFLGDHVAQSIAILSPDGRPLESLRIENTPVSLFETERGLYVTTIGSLLPSEVQRAELLLFERQGDQFGPRKVLLKGLPRASHTEFGDFNQDGRMDLAMCLFDNHRGRFSWFESLGGDQYRENVLYEKSGPIHCVAHDFSGDGKLDFALLVAQSIETLFILTNDGQNEFDSKLVFQRHPASGHNYFELADFDQDGRMDLLVVNGDNGEFQSPPKNYHGLRIYLNRGGTRFEEAYFFPQNGATKAMARDFDGDGDLDIAAIAYYPDYEKSPRESFVYLQNQGGLKFSASTFPQCISGRWLVMDVGDADGDGDLDIYLGSFIRGPSKVPAPLSQTWEKQGPSLILLRNNLK